RDAEDWEALARLKQSVLDRTEDVARRIALRVELGILRGDKLSDADAAAQLWMAILEDDPLHEIAFTHYAEYLKKRHDHRALADLLEFSLEAMAAADAPTGKQIQRLEDVAEIAEKRLGDLERAVAAWRRIDELEGGRATD